MTDAAHRPRRPRPPSPTASSIYSVPERVDPTESLHGGPSLSGLSLLSDLSSDGNEPTQTWRPQPKAAAAQASTDTNWLCDDQGERYRLGPRLGQGGFAEVFAAELASSDDSPGTPLLPIAIKRLRPALRADPLRRRQLRREAAILATLHHPNIAAFQTLLEIDGEPAARVYSRWVDGVLDSAVQHPRVVLAETVTPARARSAPGSFHARLGRREATLDYATLVFRGAGGWRRTTLDADVFVASPAWKQGDINAGIFTINFYSDAKSEGSALSIGPDYSTFGNPGAAKNGAAITFDQWFHLHVVIDPAGSARLELGAQVLEQTFPPLSPNAGAITTVELGISGYNKPCPQFDVWYDNVTIDFQ